MSKYRRNESLDNSMLKKKAKMRQLYLPTPARVLDLYSGEGELYKLCYKGQVKKYHGVDKEKIHTPALCTLAGNINFVRTHDISNYNVFDLDAYGTPWKLIYTILQKLAVPGAPEQITMFVTDGLIMHQKVDSRVTKWVSATEGIPPRFKLPGINRFYVDIFCTMLKDLRRRYAWKTDMAKYFHNQKVTVFYWVLKLTLENPIPIQGKG